MPTVVRTVDDFLEVVRKSGCVDEPRLKTFLDAVTPASRTTSDPREFASVMEAQGLLTRFQIKQLLGGRWRGFQIAGKYRLLDLLGVGGMGKVFLCEHIRMKRRVALKMLPEQQMRIPGAI